MRFIFTVLMVLFGLSSYSQDRAKKTIEHMKELKLEAKETSDEVFLITADSVKHIGKKLSMGAQGFITATEYFKIDNQKFLRKKKSDIIAWQSEYSYSIFFDGAKDFDPVRIVKGKINLYEYYVLENHTDKTPTRYVYFLMEKQKNQYTGASFENMDAMFSDNKMVLDKYHELYPDDIRKKSKYPRQNQFNLEYAWHENMIMLIQMYNK